MATVNISLEVPAASGWNTDELVVRVKETLSALFALKPNSGAMPLVTVKSEAKAYEPSPQAKAFIRSLQWEGGNSVPANENGFDAMTEMIG